MGYPPSGTAQVFGQQFTVFIGAFNRQRRKYFDSQDAGLGKRGWWNLPARLNPPGSSVANVLFLSPQQAITTFEPAFQPLPE